jgi:SSS family solute:Na+ symporter
LHAIDLAIIVGYLAAVIAAGFWFGRRQQTTQQYFLAGHGVPWWAISASIVATETSTITFISVPGLAWAKGGDFRFLQLVLGYLVARVIIASVFMPWYFRGELVTVYELLRSRFGNGVKALAASLFVMMRTVADGVRLLLTAYVLAAVFRSLGLEGVGVTASVIGLGAVMILFTLAGGIEAIVWIEVAQLAIYVTGAIAAAVVLILDVGLAPALAAGSAAGKFRLFDFSFDLTKNFTFWSGLVGGTFLTLSTHGTDQYLVQRYLCTDRVRSASKALLASGVVVLLQFAGFLFIGVLLFAFYGPERTFAAPDQVFPDFIANHLPVGLSGLVVAAILAAAMSSSLNSIAATVIADLYRPFVRATSDRRDLFVSRIVTVCAGVVQIAVGIALQREARSALSLALSVASLINGPILGVFFLGATRRANRAGALAGMTAGLVTVALVAFATRTAWPWYTVAGSLTTFAVGTIASWITTSRDTAEAA